MTIQSWFVGIGAAALLLGTAGSGLAQTIECQNDVDCAGTACGTEVCQWLDTGDHLCMDPGSEPKGSDGWCTTTDDCKCKDLGATCVGVWCTFVRPEDAPGAGGSGSGGTGSGSGGSTAGTTSSAGTSSAPAKSDDGGGCSMARAPSSGLWAFGVAIGVGALAFGLRRRR